ncbi:unnamed protein product [Adineta steineri]|uniref:WD repeat-containing protein 91 n=2 Tax=Adineta steineri TaxID=433720 RepID=A0A819TBE6_9BILA|nr:unnamed protein product [Adineta steineri]
MAGSFSFVDDLIRDYLNYRGLTSTLRTFDNEISKNPIGQFRADRITEQLTLYIHQFDINNLIDYWTQIEQHLLSALILRSQQQTNVLTKIRTNLYRCYLIHAIQSSKTEKVNEFFDRLAKILQQSNEWTKEWFALPFIKNPEENSIFQLYFSKQWNDLFWISLQNFLSTAFYHMTPPKICSLEENNAQQFGNLISQQTTNSKTLLPPSARIDPSISQFAEVVDEIQISPSPSTNEQQRQTNSTIISKFRHNFLPNTKQTTSRNKLPSKTSFAQRSQESTTGNQILLSTDDTTISQAPLLPTTATTSSLLTTRPKSVSFIHDDAHIDMNEERLIHLAELKHHSGTIIDCKLNMDGSFYSTLDVQSHVKIWSTSDDFDIITSLTSRSALQCQAFDTHEPFLYLGTSVSTIKVFHITEKRIVNEAIIDKNYPRIMYLQPHTNQNRLFVSLASTSRLNTIDNNRIRSGRVCILDLNTWSVERVLADDDENFVTCLNIHSDKQLLVLGFNDGKVALYDIRSNTLIHQKQQHSRFIQDIHFVNDYLYTIGNDNIIVQSNLSSFDQVVKSYELPYSAVGPFQTSTSVSPSETSTPLFSAQKIFPFNNNSNNLFPIGSIFDIDPYDSDRLITCSPINARFYRLSSNNVDDKLRFPTLPNSSFENFELNFPSTCVHWNKDKDMCMTAHTNGIIQLYRRINKPDI